MSKLNSPLVCFPPQVLAQRRPWLQRCLAYEDEVLALASLLLDRHSLSTVDATFAESLYGLKRSSVAGANGHGPRLSGRQKSLSLLFEVGAMLSSPYCYISHFMALLSIEDAADKQMLMRNSASDLNPCCADDDQVLLPYLRAKCHRLYNLHVTSGVLGLALQRRAALMQTSTQAQQGASGDGSLLHDVLQRARGKALQVIAAPVVKVNCRHTLASLDFARAIRSFGESRYRKNTG